jgi:hypothetical protein
MAQNLRILNVVINSSTEIAVTFTSNLTPELVPANVSILSQTPNAPDSEVLQVSVVGATLTITCQPLTTLAAYFLQFQSTAANPFISINADAQIGNDGISNKTLITGPMSSDNPVANYLSAYFQNNIYDLASPVLASYIQSLSINMSRALYDIRQAKNENYLSYTIIDEQKYRGPGPFDRLNEESAYEVMRVGLGPTASNATMNMVFDDFPSYPITLQRQITTDLILPSSEDQVGTFNINTLTFNLQNNPISKVDSITFTLLTSYPNYTYDIPTLGYQLESSRYDQDFASSYLLLEDNQVKLSEKVLEDPNFAIDQIFNITIQYEYKSLGRQIDDASLDVFTTLQSIREVLPPIINVFNLKNAPITDASNNPGEIGDVVFTDPNSTLGTPHPAFTTEIPFSLSSLPFMIGQYSIDYPNGTVYVYGSSGLNDGTGPSPPLATYYYKFDYSSEIDYVLDPDSLDVVSLPNGSLINFPGTVTFNYEQILVPGTDYIAEVHEESLNERVANRLNAINVLTTENSPITDVFQVYNETSGEIYNVDRWEDNRVYFRYNSAPRILSNIGENSSFLDVSNELLTVNNTVNNGIKIFTIFLADNNIIAGTQDAIGSSFNTTLTFNNTAVFVSEKWYNIEFNVTTNLQRLTAVGQYMVDYGNGIVYVAVANDQDFNIGSASYKKNSIVPDNSHIISVNDIYYRISPLNPKNKQFTYVSFGDTSIVPDNLDVSDEAFLNDTVSAPYQIFNNEIGAFVGSTFVDGVTNQIKFVRSIFDFNDLSNNTSPTNFAQSSTFSGNVITVQPINKQAFENVQYDGTHFYVNLNENIPFLSSTITYTFSVVRVSDGQQLWNSSSGSVVPGNPIKLVLPGTGSPAIGDLVNVNYSFTINSLARVVVDYNKGDFFIDYSYVADEILVSYEYGDNALDFRQNKNLPQGTQYYVSYKVGALRDALLKNFGTLVNVPLLATFDLELDRERYRDALMAALSSFIQGPTIAAMKNIGQIISHIEPAIVESAFNSWSLGSSILFPEPPITTGSFQLVPAKYGNGALINSNQTIKIPANSNLRLEEGSFEQWILPQWNGLDNDAELTFQITVNNLPIAPSRVFIGASEYHPIISAGNFSLNKNDNVSGYPNTNKDGVFIYYDNDASGNYLRWYVEIIDGYVFANNNTYTVKISSNGKFYDLQSLTLPKPSNLTTTTGTNSATVTITGGFPIDEGFSFVSDIEHFILDFGTAKNNSRLSIFKDVSGYMNFRVFDKNGVAYSLSSDISSWKMNEPHMVAASWKLNSRNNRDEMHLFIDGFEVPNIIRYGQKLNPYLHEKYRTIDPEEVVGLASSDIIGSDDLVTAIGSPVVTSSINFSAYNISIGNTIFINEIGFNTAGYTITNINGQTLTLNTAMPTTLTNARFSVNQTNYFITSDINVAPSVAISTIHTFITGADLQVTINSPTVSSTSTNFTTANVLPGYLLRIDNGAFNLTYTILQVSGHSLTITDEATINLTNATYQIYSNTENELPGVNALRPDYSISQDSNFNNVLTVFNDVFKNDLILIRTFGINSRTVKQNYYVWSDGYENVLMTQLPPPISLDQATITKIIVPNIAIGPANSTLSGGIFTSNNLPFSPPTNNILGRTLSATLSGTNIDFTTPAQVIIHGTSSNSPITETISFSDYGTLNFVHAYQAISYIQVVVKPINSSKNAGAVIVEEKYPLTYAEFSDGYVPIVRFSYHIGGGYTLSGSGSTVSDGYNLFSMGDVGNYLMISSPAQAAGYYVISAVSTDRHSLTVSPVGGGTVASFTAGTYQILDVNAYRSGLQNGFFTFELKNMPGTPYLLRDGFYKLEYETYASIKFKPFSAEYIYLGSDMFGHHQANSVLDQTVIYSIMLEDTRIGMSVPNNQRSITKDFNSLKPWNPDMNTLVFINFDEFPFTNIANFYTNGNSQTALLQSSWAVNDNFPQSIVILDKPIVLSNEGLLDTKKEGTIEFWMSPLYDTANDPQERYYFDASSAIVEEAISTNNVSVKISNPASQILSVTLKAGDPTIDYFAGGTLSIDTENAIQENTTSQGNGSVKVSQAILQVISVKIVGDLSGKDYGQDSVIGSDGKTIYLSITLPRSNLTMSVIYKSTATGDNNLNGQVIRLNRQLPSQNSQVVVNYLPQGVQGDRISIYKDTAGYMNFKIRASNVDYALRAQAVWDAGSWHRVKCQYRVNSKNSTMALFLDGYEYNNLLFGQGALFGSNPYTFGSTTVGGSGLSGTTILFSDPINYLYVGSDYLEQSGADTLLSNLRISNAYRPLYTVFGENLDVNYTSILKNNFPVESDLYTTYLQQDNSTKSLVTNFATLISDDSNDFTITIFDEFSLIANSAKLKEILNSLILTLSPANSRPFIKYA